MSEDYLLGLGARKDKRDKRDFRVSGILPPAAAVKERIVLEEAFGSKNQYSRGSCTSQA